MEEKYRHLVDNMRDGYSVIQDGKIVFENRRSAEIYGNLPGSGLGRMVTDFVAPDDHQRAMEAYMNVINGGDPAPEGLELKGIKEDGTIFPIQVGAKLIEYEGKPAVSVIVRDITGLKKTEEALQQSRDQFQAIVENTFDTIMIVDDSGSISYISPTIKYSLGYEPDEWAGQKLFDFAHPEDMLTVGDLFKKLTQDPDYTNYHGFMELRARHKDGSWRTLVPPI